MDSSSPIKRRVLGALDPNAASPRTPQQLGTKQTMKMDPVASRSPSHAQIHTLPSPPRGDDAELRKRPMQQQMTARMEGDEDEQVEPSHKRPCLRDPKEEDVAGGQESPVSPLRHGSASPEGSSVFDNSIIDTSHATTVTEPDEQQPGGANPLYAAAAAAVAASAPVRRRAGSRLTREEAREKAETIRLRLGLAAYKVRTGQTDVPLEHLQVRPMVLPRSNSRHALPSPPLYTQRQQPANYIDARRPLPGGISISAFGASGNNNAVRSPSQEGDQQQATTTPTTANSSPIKVEHEELGNEQMSNEQPHKSSPPMMHSAPLGNEPDSLPQLGPPRTIQRDQAQLVQQIDCTNGRITTVGRAGAHDTDLEALPGAASGLLSLARG